MVSLRAQKLEKLYREIKCAIGFDQPKLIAEPISDGIVVEGTYILTPTADTAISQGPMAEYDIRIFFPSSFPAAEPKVIETGNTIPHHEDYHINPDGTCCVVIWEAWTSTETKISVQAYFDGPLKNFFLGQRHKILNGHWPFGEERHGKDGLVDAFAAILGCSRNDNNVRYLLRVLSKDWPKGHWDCPCGSGRIIRKCCTKDLADLSNRIPKRNAQRMLARLRTYDRRR